MIDCCGLALLIGQRQGSARNSSSSAAVTHGQRSRLSVGKTGYCAPGTLDELLGTESRVKGD